MDVLHFHMVVASVHSEFMALMTFIDGTRPLCVDIAHSDDTILREAYNVERIKSGASFAEFANPYHLAGTRVTMISWRGLNEILTFQDITGGGGVYRRHLFERPASSKRNDDVGWE
jgi:hypothetical protein